MPSWLVWLQTAAVIFGAISHAFSASKVSSSLPPAPSEPAAK